MLYYFIVVSFVFGWVASWQLNRFALKRRIHRFAEDPSMELTAWEIALLDPIIQKAHPAVVEAGTKDWVTTYTRPKVTGSQLDPPLHYSYKWARGYVDPAKSPYAVNVSVCMVQVHPEAGSKHTTIFVGNVVQLDDIRVFEATVCVGIHHTAVFQNESDARAWVQNESRDSVEARIKQGA
jgi:hypothetical protein